jgi:hypothetical protein
MKKFKLILLLPFVAFLGSCENHENHEISDDLSYPTTIERLSETTLLQMRNDFAQENPYISSTLNQFGFCHLGESYKEVTTTDSMSKEEAIAAVKDFVARNPIYTGVKNPDDLRFRDISKSTGYGNAIFWHFKTENQIINNTEVLNTQIFFQIQNRTLTSCYENWYPNIYIPQKFNFDSEKAKSTLLGKEIVHYDYFGQPYVAGTVTAELLEASSAKLIIFPIRTEDKIELRVTWEINIPQPIYNIFCIDVMTGEIVSDTPTIIS